MGIGERLKQAREAMGFSKSELARRIGVHPSACIQWESANGTNPSMEHLIHAAEILEVNLEWLGTGRGEMAYDGETQESALSADEFELVKAFRRLDATAKAELLAAATSQTQIEEV